MKIKPFTTLMDLVNAHLFDAPPVHRRILMAYDLAWAKVGKAPTADNLDVLVEELKTLQAPGAYTLDSEPVITWVAAWKDGLDPNQAEARVIAKA